MSGGDREFLFTYRFGGREWGTSVFASNPAEAREKIKAVALARYDGELVARIPVSSGVVQAIVSLRNLLRRISRG